MTRDEFIKGYAERSNIKIEPRHLLCGYIQPDKDWILLALPCACGSESCHGWGMVGPEHFQHHMQFSAPDDLREAYLRYVPI